MSYFIHKGVFIQLQNLIFKFSMKIYESHFQWIIKMLICINLKLLLMTPLSLLVFSYTKKISLISPKLYVFFLFQSGVFSTYPPCCTVPDFTKWTALITGNRDLGYKQLCENFDDFSLLLLLLLVLKRGTHSFKKSPSMTKCVFSLSIYTVEGGKKTWL